MRYLSVCSGIEAASAAWHDLGWTPLAFSEIEPFPRAVLAHHFPDVPLHGDFTVLRDQPWIVDADLLVGGTPCQAFSVAGLRGSLADARGNLTLEFVRLANAIDDLRRAAGRAPLWVLWENVPGVLSVADNAFGSFLGGLVGSDAAIEPPPGRGWTDAGVVHGPRRCAAWRVLDAQHFGLAQRRRRVFVLARGGAGAWSAADALLPVIDSMSWHPAPRREAREGSAAGAACGARGGGGLGTDAELDGALIASTGPVSHCLNAGGMGRQDYETETLIAHALRAEGFDASEDGTGRGTPLVPVAFAIQAGALRENPESGPDGAGVKSGLAYTLEARSEVQAVAFAQNSRDEVLLQNGDGQIVGALAAEPGMKQTTYVAFQPRIARNGRGDMGDLVNALQAQSGGTGKGDAAPCVAVADTLGVGANQTSGFQSEVAAVGMQVRRLTPRECERLQGFPDDWTAIPWRGKPAAECPDGPRYKSLGNSMAVPCMRWIGERIAEVSA